MPSLNKLANCKNRFQGADKKVLCICSAGLLRSPTAAMVLSQKPFNYNTRAAGIDHEYALIEVSDVLLEWADEFVVMESWMEDRLKEELTKVGLQCKPIICLDIQDKYPYNDFLLVKAIKKNYTEITGLPKKVYLEDTNE